ncbi:hypothetical protein L195_g039254, partial [Trifolium pratense]
RSDALSFFLSPHHDPPPLLLSPKQTKSPHHHRFSLSLVASSPALRIYRPIDVFFTANRHNVASQHGGATRTVSAPPSTLVSDLEAVVEDL